MANRKRRTKPPDLQYLSYPGGDAFWSSVLCGNHSGLLRPMTFPPDVPMKAFMRELRWLVSRLAESRTEMQEAKLGLAVKDLLEPTRKDRDGSYSERDVAERLGVTKDKVHRHAKKQRLSAAMLKYLDDTLQQRTSPNRPSPRKTKPRRTIVPKAHQHR